MSAPQKRWIVLGASFDLQMVGMSEGSLASFTAPRRQAGGVAAKVN